jgi:hypothetical protein
MGLKAIVGKPVPSTMGRWLDSDEQPQDSLGSCGVCRVSAI